MAGVDTSLGVTFGGGGGDGGKKGFGASKPKSKTSPAEEEDRFLMIIREMKEDREE
jgi:hypothetical protein